MEDNLTHLQASSQSAILSPRFVFIHRIGVGNLSPDEAMKLMSVVQEQLANKRNLPIIEYFVPNRNEADGSYTLTVVDLMNMTKLDS